MVLTSENITVQTPEIKHSSKRKGRAEVLKLLRATLIITSVNAVIVAWFFLSPNLTIRTDLERLHPLDEQGVISKTSPFESYQPETVNRQRPMAAAKMRPVFQPVESSYELDLPARTMAAVSGAAPEATRTGYVNGSKVYELLEAQMERVSRVSASLREPMRRLSERAMEHIETRIAPRVSDPGKSLRTLR